MTEPEAIEEVTRDQVGKVRQPVAAPQWLVERMEILRRQPPPTIDEVFQQLEASARHRAARKDEWESLAKYTHYGDIKPCRGIFIGAPSLSPTQQDDGGEG